MFVNLFKLNNDCSPLNNYIDNFVDTSIYESISNVNLQSIVFCVYIVCIFYNYFIKTKVCNNTHISSSFYNKLDFNDRVIDELIVIRIALLLITK